MSEKILFMMLMAKINIFISLAYIQREMSLIEKQLSVSNVSQENVKWIWQFSIAYFGREMLFQYWSCMCTR